MNKWEVFLSEHEVDPGVCKNIEKVKSKTCFMDIISIDYFMKNLVIVNSKFHDYSPGGGVARYSHLTVFYGEQTETKGWQYSDKWSRSDDRWDLMVLKIGEIRASACHTDKMEVSIGCVAPHGYSPRTVTFTFDLEE